MKKILKFTKRTALTLLVIVAIVLLPIGGAKAYQRVRALTLSPAEKQLEDISRLDYLIRHEFGGFDALVDPTNWEAQLTGLREQVASESGLAMEPFRLEVIKLVASLRDAHTGVYGYRDLIGETFPFRIEWHDGSFYLSAGQMKDDKWLGSRVTGIDGHTPSEIHGKLSRYAGSSNPSGRALFMAPFASIPAVLFHEGLITHRHEMTIAVENAAGESRTFSYTALPREALGALADYRNLAEKFADAEKPLFRTRAERFYWLEYLAKEDVLYVRYSLCVDQGDIEQFWQELFRVADAKRPAKFVLDIRGNPGGDTKNNVSLLQKIRQRPWLNTRGRLFTITDRRTGSAAISLASHIERQTRAILVGEMPCDRANTTSDPTFFTLPHSDITILLPNLYSLHSHSHDKRIGISPEWPVIATLAGDGYLDDPAMSLILNYNPDTERESPRAASLPSDVAGTYAFSPLRNLTLSPQGDEWTLAIDGWIDTHVLENNSRFTTAQHGISIVFPESPGDPLTLHLDGSTVTAPRIPDDQLGILGLIKEGKLTETQARLLSLQSKEFPPPFLKRSLLHARVYEALRTDGLDRAVALNEVNRALFPADPVVPIIEFELYQSSGGHFWGKTQAVIETTGKLLRRYLHVITTDRLMNDDYNAFIGS